MAPGKARAQRGPERCRLMRHTGALLLGGVAIIGSWRCLVSPSASRNGMPLVAGFRRTPGKVRGPLPVSGMGDDGVSGVSPEMIKQAQKYAQKYEDIMTAGEKLWAKMKKAGNPKKIYFIGPNGNSGDEIATSTLEALAYISSPDGAFYMNRRQEVDYPEILFNYWHADKELKQKSEKDPVKLFMESEEEYRTLETKVLREFADEADNGYPFGCIVPDAAVLKEENVEMMKKGIIIWLEVDQEYSWGKCMHRSNSGGGLYVPPGFQAKPPVWCITRGLDGDIDDTEAKEEYQKEIRKHAEIYEKLADIRIRADIPGIAENSYWAVPKIVTKISELLGFVDEMEPGAQEELLEKALQKFLEGARLSKYLKPALKWCEDQGAASMDDIAENVADFSEALGLKALEAKRLEKAAAAIVAAGA